MSKKSLTIIFVLIILAAGSLAYVLLSKNARQADQANTSKTESVDKQVPISDSKPSAAASKGVYAPYSTEQLSSAKGTVLLFFHAPWCPQCRAIEATINESGVPDNVTVLKVDYDTNQPLRQKYGVTLQTTFVKVDSKGEKLASYVAYEEPTFAAVQRELLP